MRKLCLLLLFYLLIVEFFCSINFREQKIFECIIHNLFEEYKFFPKYPERQLKIVAVLFGESLNLMLVIYQSVKCPFLFVFLFVLLTLSTFSFLLGCVSQKKLSHYLSILCPFPFNIFCFSAVYLLYLLFPFRCTLKLEIVFVKFCFLSFVFSHEFPFEGIP